MIESSLRARLRAVDPDSDPGVEDRAWEIVRGAHRPPPGARLRRRRRWRITVPAVASMLALAAGTLAVASPPREALGRWLREAIGLSATPHLRPMLAGLPGGGQLLVNSPTGPWIVSADGHRRYLGAYTAAAWSPHSLYVVAWRRTQLDALNPLGQQQWTLASAAAISVARWSPDGYRIAYIAGRGLWIVAGDGSETHQLYADVAPAAPAWQPHTGTTHRIAFVDQSGDIRLLDADSEVQLWRAKARPAVRQLLWSPDGTRLLAVFAGRVELYNSEGRLLADAALPAGQTISQAAFAPIGDQVALAVRQTSPAGESVAVQTATPRGLHQPPHILFSADAYINAIDWSPDDLWLVASSPSADQWIFIRTRPPVRFQAVSRITAQFASSHRAANGFPTLSGWQPPAPTRPAG